MNHGLSLQVLFVVTGVVTGVLLLQVLFVITGAVCCCRCAGAGPAAGESGTPAGSAGCPELRDQTPRARNQQVTQLPIICLMLPSKFLYCSLKSQRIDVTTIFTPLFPLLQYPLPDE